MSQTPVKIRSILRSFSSLGSARLGLAALGTIAATALTAMAAGGEDGSAVQPAAKQHEFRLPDTAYFTRGRYLYQEHCMVCHGTRGRGDGELVKPDWPDKPRNFTTGVFQYQSTPPGSLPTDADLTRTIRTGIANTNMPSFAHLPDDDIRTLVEYIKFMSRAWRNPDNYGDPIEIPDVPAWFAQEETLLEHQEKGRQLFLNTCASCHGEKGDGLGPAAAALVDANGEPVKPADLRGMLKSGRNPEDTFRTIAVGLNLTPMVGFGAVLEDEEIWNLVAYIFKLRADHDQEHRITRFSVPDLSKAIISMHTSTTGGLTRSAAQP